MTHLSLNERLALIEADGEPDHPHLTGCARCRAEVTAARAVLAEAGRARVPEPSPLFWEHFSRRVSEQVAAVARERARGRRAPWRVLVPLAVGVAALVLTVVITRGPVAHRDSPARTGSVRSVDEIPAGVVAEDGQWLVLSQVAEEFDLETLSDSLGVSGASESESAVWQLSEQERAELAALLRAELRPGRSGS